LLFSAWWTVWTSIVVVTFNTSPNIVEGNSSAENLILSAIIGLTGLIGSVAALALFAGMWTHRRMSGLGYAGQIIWGAIMVLLLPIGAVFYFFGVYQKDSAIGRL
jgi:hypothetical protein